MDPLPPTDDEAPDQILPSDRATQRTNPDPRSREVPVTSPEGQVIPVTFGRARQAGDVIYCETDGVSKIYIAMSFGWGPCNNLDDIELDNFPGDDYGLFVGSPRFNLHLGTPDQAIDSIIAAFDEDHFTAWPGLCYVVYVLDLNIERNQSVNPTNFKCSVDGQLSVDHRQDDTLATTYYHDNPCLALIHVFLDQSWGFGADPTQMRWASWDEAADDCDAVIADADDGEPTTEPTVTIDGTVGAITSGTRQWGYTWVYASGVESKISPPSDDVTQIPQWYAVTVSDLDQGTDNVTGIRLYRRKKDGGGNYGPWNLVADIDPKQPTWRDGSYDVIKGGTHPPGTNSKAQFRIGMKMRAQASMRDWVETFRTLFTAFVAFNNGQYQCFVDKERDELGTLFDETCITGNLEILTVGIASIPAYVEVSFVDRDNGFLQDKRTWPAGAPVAADIMARLEKRPWQFECEGCPTPDQAEHIARWAYIRGQRSHRIKARVNQRAILVLPGSIVDFSHVAHDFGTAKSIITSTGPVDDTLGWNLSAEIYVVEDYDWTYHPGFTRYGGGNPIPPLPPSDPPTPLILRWRVYITDTIEPTPPE